MPTPQSQVKHAVRRFQQGAKLHAAGNAEGAVREYRRGLAITPSFAPGHMCLGLALASLEQPIEAEQELRQAIALDPTLSGAYLALGKLRAAQGDVAMAMELFRSAALHDPTSPAAYADWWKAADELLLLDERVLAGRQYVALRPDHVEARWDLALHELAIGALAPGWEGFDMRWQHPKYERWHYPLTAPRWRGEDLTDKRILVWREQGVGDEIMFASCIPDLIAKAGHVTFGCTDRLMPLFTRSFPQADVINSDRMAPPNQESFDVDYQVAVGGLPRFLRPTVDSFPAHAGYLTPDPVRTAQWRSRLAALGSGIKVGISWRSSLMTAERAKEYSTLDQWGPILQTPGLTFVNLQYDDCALALANVQETLGVHVHRWPDLDLKNDFDSAAALIKNLDLVITIGNAVGELAGALDVPVWRLLSAEVGDWTMLGTTRRPWFPSMRVFGAAPRNNWEGLLRRVGDAVQQFRAEAPHEAAA